MGEGGYETRTKAADTTDRVYTTRRLQWRKWEEEGREDKKGKETHENKLPTAKLLACIHGMQKGDGGEGGQGRVVSGKGQTLTTYRGPPPGSGREGGIQGGNGGIPNPTRGGAGSIA